MAGKAVFDVVHKTAVVALVAGSAYGAYFVTSCVMELKRAAANSPVEVDKRDSPTPSTSR